MQSIEVNAIRVAFEQVGAGPPLVLVHGAVSDSRVWQPQLDALAGEFTVVAWDAPGCGQSGDPPDSFRLPEYADVLAGLIAALGLERAHVLGHSFGGALALELARRHPAAVATLILVGAYAGWAGSLPAVEVERRLSFALDVAERLPGGFEPASMPGLFTDRMPSEAVARLTTIMSEIRPAATRAMAHALAEADLREGLLFDRRADAAHPRGRGRTLTTVRGRGLAPQDSEVESRRAPGVAATSATSKILTASTPKSSRSSVVIPLSSRTVTDMVTR